MAESVVAQDGRWAVFAVSNTGYVDDQGNSWVAQALDAQVARLLPLLMG